MNGFYIAPAFMDSLWFTSPRSLWTCLTSRSPSFMLLVFFILVVKWTLEPSVESQVTFSHISTMVLRPWMSAKFPSSIIWIKQKTALDLHQVPGLKICINHQEPST